MVKKSFSIIFLIFLFSPGLLYAADLSITPQSGTFYEGDRVTLQVSVSSSMPINAVSATIQVPPLFSIESVSKNSSVLNFWVSEPSFSNSNGIVSFEGVALNGYSGNLGNVATIVVRSIKAGDGSMSIKNAQILANDGKGTNITGALKNAVFTVLPAPIKEKEVVPEKKSEPKVEPAKVEETLPEPTIEIVQKPPLLSAPEIMRVRKFGESAIAGITRYPRSQALITFTDRNGYKVFITTDTDEKGEFYTIIPKSLKYGQYKVTAVVITNNLDNSTKSNELDITIGSIVSDIGIWPIVGALGVFIVLITTLLRKTILLKKSIQNAKDKIRKVFKILEEDVKKGSVKDLKEDMKDAEREIEREVKDIGSL